MAINAKLFLLCATAERPTWKWSGYGCGCVMEWWHPSFLFPWAAAAAPAIISGSHEECGVLYLWCNFRFGRKSNGKDAVKEIYKFKEYVKYLKYIYI